MGAIILLSMPGKINSPILNQSYALNSLGVWLYFSKVFFTSSYVSNYLLNLFSFVWNFSCVSLLKCSVCSFRIAVQPIALIYNVHHCCKSKKDFRLPIFFVCSPFVSEIFVGGFYAVISALKTSELISDSLTCSFRNQCS